MSDKRLFLEDTVLQHLKQKPHEYHHKSHFVAVAEDYTDWIYQLEEELELLDVEVSDLMTAVSVLEANEQIFLSFDIPYDDTFITHIEIPIREVGKEQPTLF